MEGSGRNTGVNGAGSLRETETGGGEVGTESKRKKVPGGIRPE